MTRAVLHAHPDRWTVGMDQHLPPEERARLREALVGFAAELLSPAPFEVEEPEGVVEDTSEQRAAVARWRDRDARDLTGTLGAALDAVVCGGLWDSPVFRTAAFELRFHRGFRIVLDGPAGDLSAAAARHGLLLRDR